MRQQNTKSDKGKSHKVLDKCLKEAIKYLEHLLRKMSEKP